MAILWECLLQWRLNINKGRKNLMGMSTSGDFTQDSQDWKINHQHYPEITLRGVKVIELKTKLLFLKFPFKYTISFKYHHRGVLRDYDRMTYIHFEIFITTFIMNIFFFTILKQKILLYHQFKDIKVKICYEN